MRQRVLLILGTVLLALVAYLLAWPVPIEPEAWQSPTDLGFAGRFAPNEKLAGLRMIPLGNHEGPEDVAVARDGRLYVAVDHGLILRVTPPELSGKDWQVAEFANTGGRPLGVAFAPRGARLPRGWSVDDLIVADGYRGLLRVTPEGVVSVLTDRVPSAKDGERSIAYADNADIARDGRIYFSDATTRFPAKEYGGTFPASVLDILDHRGFGRLLVYDPHDGSTTVLARGFVFANGVALDAREQSVFLAESGSYRVHRVWLHGPRTGQTEVVLENLPGYPDNVNRGASGLYWVGLTKPRSKLLDYMADKPFLRKMAARLPDFLKPIPPAYGAVFAFDERGNIVRNLQDPAGSYPSTTGVTETRRRLYIQSLHAKGVLGYLEQ